MTTFSCIDITRRYRHFLLDHVSFTMESGYFYVLAGVNGSGKTTLLDCLSGAALSSAPGFTGDARLGGLSLRQDPEGLTYGAFYPDWSVKEYSSWLMRLGVDASKRVFQLSKGEFMKMQICFALAHHPDFLFLDEPLEGFDPVFRREFLELLGELLEQDMGILLSTHITEDVDRLADYVLILENGQLAANATKEELSDRYASVSGTAAPHIRDLLELEHRKEGGAP